MFNICSEEVLRDGNMFGLSRYLRDCGKFKTCAVIFMENGLVNCSKGFGYCMIFIMYLGIFEDHRVDLLNQFTNTNQFTHEC